MDTMKIESGFMQFLISKIIKKSLIKKTGNPDLEFAFVFKNPLEFKNDGENVNLSLDVMVAMKTQDLLELMKNTEF